MVASSACPLQVEEDDVIQVEEDDVEHRWFHLYVQSIETDAYAERKKKNRKWMISSQIIRSIIKKYFSQIIRSHVQQACARRAISNPGLSKKILSREGMTCLMDVTWDFFRSHILR